MAFSVRLPSMLSLATRQLPQACVNSRSRADASPPISLSVSMLVRGIDRAHARAGISARIGVAAGVVEGIFDTLQIPPRRGGRALLVTGERAVAQSRIFVALDAEGIAGADRPRRCVANHHQ